MWQEQCLRYKDEDIQGCLLKSQRHRLHFGSRASFLMTFLILFLFVCFLKQATIAADSTCFILYIFNVYSCFLENVSSELSNSFSVSMARKYKNLLV